MGTGSGAIVLGNQASDWLTEKVSQPIRGLVSSGCKKINFLIIDLDDQGQYGYACCIL